ncbi:MAG TPA: hypothetical protein PKC28_09230, partial [Bdellovibrionales bacterium]|nr:hypothetical protein [Bdellovibrionales bacterium]
MAKVGQSLWVDAFKRLRRDKIAMVSLIVILAYLLMSGLCAAGLMFTDFDVTNNANAYQPPNAEHWLGTDIFGRDVISRAAHGTVTSLIVGFWGAALAVFIGTVLGAVAGYFGGVIDELIVWLYTTVDTIPYILLVVAFSFV